MKLKHLLNTITYIIVLLVIVNIVTALFLPSSFTIWTNRLRGIFDNPNTLGTFNLASMPFLLYAFNINTGLKKAFFTIIISLNILLSLVAFSRASILGIAICLCVYFFFFYRKLFYLSILFMCLTIVIIFSSPLLLELLRLADDPFSMRDRMWEIGLLALKKNIWLGVGFGTTPTITNDIFQFTLRGITDFNLGKRFANIYIEVLVETGILGMFLFLLLIFLMVNQSIKSLKYKIGNEAILVKCYLSLLAGILIHGFFESFILSAGNTSSILFWILTGLCLNPFKFEHLNER
ncbi:MAG: O-antigen ligase family protein [Ignavibacteriales bacterium]|nr:O-antigen ligase family protein [Ignavibacteriales bacterium]